MVGLHRLTLTIQYIIDGIVQGVLAPEILGAAVARPASSRSVIEAGFAEAAASVSFAVVHDFFGRRVGQNDQVHVVRPDMARHQTPAAMPTDVEDRRKHHTAAWGVENKFGLGHRAALRGFLTWIAGKERRVVVAVRGVHGGSLPCSQDP
jgi:hypothetical protein